tara:strand:+ start:15784 stop:16728 length:945 start_codon:yes stop_codon:yes gene_type:complete
MKTSLISPVLNEEKNIKKFLNSIIKQTVRPDEVLIVDGGSKDKTYQILKKYSKKYKWIKIYKKIGFNISQGRNYTIKKSKGDIIFTCDSGTRLEKNWVKKILKGFEKNADVVFGMWNIEPSNIVEKFLVSRTPNWNKINPNKFIPSNRQVAFKKNVWKKVGGFPEHLKRADDNWFHLRAHNLGFKYYFVQDAKVSWILERNLKKMLKLAFLDSKTEGFSFMFVERKIYILEFLLLFLGIALVLLGIFVDLKILLYSIGLGLIFSIFIGGYIPYTKFKDVKLLFVGPFLTMMLYFAHVFGVLTGIFQRIYKKTEN